MLVAETQAGADAMAKDAEASTLADSEEFTAALERTGDPGIVTMYASKDAPAAMMKASETGSGEVDLHVQGLPGRRRRRALRRRRGRGRVHGQGPARRRGRRPHRAADPTSAPCPAPPRRRFSVAFRQGWLQDYLDQLNDLMGCGQSLDDAFAEGERATGLQLPEDIETLLGKGITVSVDGGADLKALTEAPDPSQVPAGIRIYGDPAKIVPIIDKLKASAGPEGNLVKVSTGDGLVTVGFDPAYVESLRANGDLGSVAAFKDVVPEAGPVHGRVLRQLRRGRRLGRAARRPAVGRRRPGVGEHRAARRAGHQRLGRRRPGPARAAAADHRLTTVLRLRHAHGPPHGCLWGAVARRYADALYCVSRNEFLHAQQNYGAFLADMLSSARYEVLPTPSVEDMVLAHVPLDRTVTVTASPAKGLEATLALTEQLAGPGYTAVPHLAARMVSGRTELAEIAERMVAGGGPHRVRAGRRPGPAGRRLRLGTRPARGPHRDGRPVPGGRASPATPSHTRRSATT